MRVFLATEFRCLVFKNDYYLPTRAYYIYERYAKAFGNIVLCSRFVPVEEKPFDCIKSDFIVQSVNCNSLGKCMMGVYKSQMLKAMKTCELVIGRFPSIIAFRAHDYSKQLGKPFLAELMCDGWDSYWNHGLIGKTIAPYMNYKMKKCTWNSDFAVYVTERYLQNKYPCKMPSINASNVVIKEMDSHVLERRLEKIKNTDYHNISLMTSASVDLHSKGQEYVVKAIGILKKKGINVKYYLAGDGDHEYLLKFARASQVEDNIVFLGRISFEKIFDQLDNVDIYIQPSLQEGLPRAVIEAMSRACPVMGARTAGIPELMNDESVFDRASASSIVEQLMIILQKGLETYAINSYERSKNYLDETLCQRRNCYYETIKQAITDHRV